MARNLKRTQAYAGKERRRTPRRPILDTFSLFVVVPEKGIHRLAIHDLSEGGISFDLDTAGEEVGAFPARPGDRLSLHLYLNQSLYLPLAGTLVRVEEKKGIRSVGAEFVTEGEVARGHQALVDFLKTLDRISGVASVTL